MSEMTLKQQIDALHAKVAMASHDERTALIKELEKLTDLAAEVVADEEVEDQFDNMPV